jgi:hypothetical protein
MSKATGFLRAKRHLLLGVVLVAIGVVALIAAPPPFVQYTVADGETCSSENACPAASDGTPQICCKGICQPCDDCDDT